MKRFGIGVLYGVGGYLMVAVASYFLVLQLSSNGHDREIEAAMTSAFLFGPVGAIVAFIVGIIRSGRPSATSSVDG